MPEALLSSKVQLGLALSGTPPLGREGLLFPCTYLEASLLQKVVRNTERTFIAVSYPCGICFPVEHQHLHQCVPKSNPKTEVSRMPMETQQASLMPSHSLI